MNKKKSTFVSGVIAVGIYFFVVGLLILYFNFHAVEKSTHYVKKNEDRIRVTMSAPKTKDITQKKEPSKKNSVAEKKITNKPKKNNTKKVTKKRDVPKKVVKKKVVKKKVVKKKVVKKKVVKKKTIKKNNPKNKLSKIVKKKIPKKVTKAIDLFKNVPPSKKNTETKSSKVINKNIHQVKPVNISHKKSASELVSSSLKTQKKSDKGIENAYLARIEEKLKGWPAQSDYAGEMAKVWIKVEPSGFFIFKVVVVSGNSEFNNGLIAYLKQLQRFGFGPHKGNRPYELNVEFIATQ